jgi:hypothetical protein
VRKIPVGQTIASAYRFAFGHLGAIIGLSWVPLVLVAVLQFLPYAAGHNPMVQPDNLTQAGQQALEGIGSFFLVLLLYSIVYVAVTRQALGLRRGTAIVHFALGAAELRVFGALLLFMLVIVGMVMAFGIAIALLGALAGAIKQPVVAIVVALLLLAGLGAFLFIIVRLGFLIAPVTVAEEQISLSRGWILTAGNFWRLFAVLLAIGIPLFLVYAAGTAAIAGPEFFAPLPMAPEAMQQALNARLASFGQHMPLYIGLTLLIAPFSLGLNLGAAAFAYRALAPTRRGVSAVGEAS